MKDLVLSIFLLPGTVAHVSAFSLNVMVVRIRIVPNQGNLI